MLLLTNTIQQLEPQACMAQQVQKGLLLLTNAIQQLEPQSCRAQQVQKDWLLTNTIQQLESRYRTICTSNKNVLRDLVNQIAGTTCNLGNVNFNQHAYSIIQKIYFQVGGVRQHAHST